MKKQTFIAIIALIFVAAGAGIYYLIKAQGPAVETPKVDAISATDWVEGNRDAKVVLIEYSDFQCPACGVAYPVVKQMNEQFPDDLAIVYRHFPLDGIHKNARVAAYAAEAAGAQGKFWEMHNTLFEKQNDWSEEKDAKSIFNLYAKDIGLDVLKFSTDMSSNEAKNKVKADYNSGLAAGVNGTPTFFLNGERIKSPKSVESFAQILQSAIDEVTSDK